MTELAVRERLIRLMETDWKELAASLLEERLQAVKSGKKAYVSEVDDYSMSQFIDLFGQTFEL